MLTNDLLGENFCCGIWNCHFLVSLKLKNITFAWGIKRIILLTSLSCCTLSSNPFRTSIPSESKQDHRSCLPTQAFRSQPGLWIRGASSGVMGQHCMKEKHVLLPRSFRRRSRYETYKVSHQAEQFIRLLFRNHGNQKTLRP